MALNQLDKEWTKQMLAKSILYFLLHFIIFVYVKYSHNSFYNIIKIFYVSNICVF